MKLHTRVFFFNSKTDYLPYYKNFDFGIDENSQIKSILPLIKEQNRNFNYPEQNLYFRVNGLVTNGEVSIKEIVAKLGDEITIEPVSTYRSKDSLIINDDDFYESFKILEPYCSEDDREYYQGLYGLHYASATFEYNKQYIGDAILILASRLIFNKHIKKDEILEAISCDNGLWDAEYEDNMFIPTDYYGTFNLLKNIAKAKKDINRVSSLFTRKYKAQDLSSSEAIDVAFYYGLNNSEIYQLPQSTIDKGYKEIEFSHSNKSCGIDLLKTNEELALRKAARVLADAYDSGAEILLADKKYIDYFKSNIGKIEKVANREILINLEDIDNFEFV
jgi:hypothetical protein